MDNDKILNDLYGELLMQGYTPADAEAEAARMQISFDTSALEAELAAAQAKIAAAEVAYNKAQAEEKAKAAERAAEDKAEADAEAAAAAERDKKLLAERKARE